MHDTFNIQMAKSLYHSDSSILIKLSEEKNRILILLDQNACIKYVNQEAEKLFSWNLYEVLGKKYEALCQNSQIFSAPLIQKIPYIFQGFAASNVEVSCVNQGRKHVFSFDAISLYESSKNILMIGHEITAKKAREDTLKEINHYLYSIFEHFPVNFFWKDENSNFLGADRKFLAMAGLKETEQIEGLSDFECPWKKEESIKFRKDDFFVAKTSKPKLNIIDEVSCVDRKTHKVIVSKVPLITEEKSVIGTIGIFSSLKEIQENRSLFFMMSHLLNEGMDPENRKFLFYHSKENRSVYLTKREKECLSYKVRGKTAKEIALELDLSYRTVEFYINNLNRKLNIQSRQALYDFYFSNAGRDFPSSQ